MIELNKSAFILVSVLILALCAAAIETGTITGAAGTSCSTRMLPIGQTYNKDGKAITLDKIITTNSRSSGTVAVTVDGAKHIVYGSSTIPSTTLTEVIISVVSTETSSAKLIMCVKTLPPPLTCTRVNLKAGQSTTYKGKTVSFIGLISEPNLPVLIDISGKRFTYAPTNMPNQKESNNGVSVTALNVIGGLAVQPGGPNIADPRTTTLLEICA
ncbi:MAG: hypothetical protein AABW84_00310 [Nanoarchaeota archaeon]